MVTKIIYDSKKHARKQLGYQAVKGLLGGIFSYLTVVFILMYLPVFQAFLTKPNQPASFAQTPSVIDHTYLESQAQEISQLQKEVTDLRLDLDFSLYIPKIDARSRILANIDAGSEVEYKSALQQGIAHAKGTYFPGQGKTIYLFAHSTDSPLNFVAYNAIFYQLSRLEMGDQITIYFANQKYLYQVTGKQVVEANDVSWLVRDFGVETLILQTCTPPGTTWKRLLVLANPVLTDR